MEHGPNSEPFHRRKRYDFDSFDSDITEVLKDIETGLGHAMLEGTMQAKEALGYLDAYHGGLVDVSELGDGSFSGTDSVPTNEVHFHNGNG